MIDVYLTALLSNWLTRQEENSSCKFGALQVIKVGRAGVYYKTGNEKRPTLESLLFDSKVFLFWWPSHQFKRCNSGM